MKFFLILYFLSHLTLILASNVPTDIRQDEKAKANHRIDSINILAYILLITLTICTIWLFKRRRFRYIHETGLAVIYGLIMGALIRYTSSDTDIKISQANLYENVYPPPDALYLTVQNQKRDPPRTDMLTNKTYAYTFHGEVTNVESKILNEKATFDPEIFFNIILPPIIFAAGYSLKKKFFFRNLGTIMCYAFIGTTISCFVVATIIYGVLQLIPHLSYFTFTECMFFGAIISATDPVTVLAIFHDLHVDVNLYALVFGESVLNDAVAIVLAETINSFSEHSANGFDVTVALNALANFFYIFFCSFLLGSIMGCLIALLTKFTRLCDFPLLETCLFVLMSYSTFLMAEAADLTGIVAVLFCGICQAHYTFNNLSEESRLRTKQIFELLNFLAENFIFTYIGVSMFTFSKHRWDAGFISISFLAIAVGRALHIYPLSFLLNLGRKNKIPLNFQHILFFAGLRGAIAFALAIRNTLSESRQLILTTTSLIAIVTVIVCGGSSTQLLAWFGIPVGVDDDNVVAPKTPTIVASPAQLQGKNPGEKAWLVRKWYNFDALYMKPLLTHSRPTLLDTTSPYFHWFARIFTSTQQLVDPGSTSGNGHDSDTDDFLEDSSQVVCSGDTADANGSPLKYAINIQIEGQKYI